jgi:hypothetical protein
MDYGMFSDRGNRVIDGIIIAAKEFGWTFAEVRDVLNDISMVTGFEEATDTMVVENVYEALEAEYV